MGAVLKLGLKIYSIFGHILHFSKVPTLHAVLFVERSQDWIAGFCCFFFLITAI